MYAFTYHRPTTVRQAVNLLAKNSEAKLLAGGHSLIPVMKLRLGSPGALIDMNKIEGLSGIELKGRSLVIGAMTRHVDVANSQVVKDALPALAELAGMIGDPAVRHRGTIGGAIAHNDPSADYPAAVLGLGATIITSKRRIAADDFFKGLFETALEPDEIITKVQFPKPQKAAYQKFPNPASRYALVGVFVSKRGSEIRVAVTGAGSNGVFRVTSFEEALKKRFGAKSLEGMTVPSDDMASDIHGSAEYRAISSACWPRRGAGGRGGRTWRRRIRGLRAALELREEKAMATSVKQLMEAANAAVPRITPAQAQEMIAKGNTLVVDVRDAPEVEKSGKVAGAVHVSRGMLEFRADPESPYHDKNFDKGKTVILYCASGGRSALSGKLLKDLGYDQVYNLGAFKDWAEGGGAVEKAGQT